MTGCTFTQTYVSLFSRPLSFSPVLRVRRPEAMPTDTLPFLPLPSSLPLFDKKQHIIAMSRMNFELLCIKKLFSPAAKCTPIKTVTPPYILPPPRRRANHSAYTTAEIFICIHIFLSLFSTYFLGKKKTRTFFCTLGFAIFMRAEGVPMANAATHLKVLQQRGDKPQIPKKKNTLSPQLM